jgi:hypothetical protein
MDGQTDMMKLIISFFNFGNTPKNGNLSCSDFLATNITSAFFFRVIMFLLDGMKRGITWRLRETLEDMEYAEDVCLASHKYGYMERKLDDLWEESKKVGLKINSSKTEEICINTIVNQEIRLHKESIKRSSDFCYPGSVVAEDGGASVDVKMRIQKARGSFSKLRKVWTSTSIRKDTKIKIFNARVKSVLLYGSETWLITSEIRRKIYFC